MPARTNARSHYAHGPASIAPPRQFCPSWWGLTTWLDAVLQNAPWSPWHFWHRGGHHYGCSLSAYSELLRGLGYSLVSVVLNDAIYVRTKRAAAAGFHRLRPPATARAGCRLPKSDLQAYQRGYSQLPKRKELFPWNSEVDAWLDEGTPLPARHAAIRKFFWLDTLLGFAELKPLPASRRTPLPRDYVKWLEGK